MRQYFTRRLALLAVIPAGVRREGEAVAPAAPHAWCWSALKRGLPLLLAALCGAFLPACGTRPFAGPQASPPPHLVIAFEGEPGRGEGVEPTTREKLPARLQLGDAIGEAKLDLRDWPPAAAGRKPRIDVRMRKKHYLFGMHRFSLLDPVAVGFQDAFLILGQLRREGVLAPRIRWVTVTANGVALGLMAVVEDFSKELLEFQQRREGVMFRLRPKALPVVRVDAFGGKKASDRRSAERATATGLLQAFLRGELPARDVFDVELMARFLAVAELWRADGLVRADALRFYFNPVTQRLEPIGFHRHLRISADPGHDSAVATGWPSQLLADEALRAATLRNLRRMANEMTSGALPRWLGPEEERLLDALRSEHPDRPAISLDPWIDRARFLEQRDDVEWIAGALRSAANPASGRLIAAPDVASRRHSPIPQASLAEVLERHPYLTWDAGRGVLRAGPGSWSVRGSLVLPEGIGLTLAAGTTLRFGAGEMLLGSGPLRFLGSEGNPIILEGISTGPDPGTWQGIVVLRSEAPHEWEHAIVRNTTGIDRDGWRLTGGVTFRASEVRLESSGFSGNRAEDALNLIRSGFAFRGVSILQAASDAFDCDFCEGRMVGGRIGDVGGDGIDVSGSSVRVKGVVLEDIRDKAISVGEGSRLVARGVRIRAVGTAVAGKDGSEVIFEDSQVSDVRHAAIMAYTKKPAYGPGRVSARNIAMKRVGREAVAQHGSRVHIDGTLQASEDVDVEDLYERGYMKK